MKFLSDKTALDSHVEKLTSVLLDFDGTLVDYYENEKKALTNMLVHVRIPEKMHHQIILRYRDINEQLWKEFEKKFISIDKVKVKRFALLNEEFGIDENPVKMNDLYLENFGKHVISYPGIVDRLQQFKKEHPELQLIILTNGTDTIQKTRSKVTGLDKVTDGIVSSDEAGHAKPSSRIFEYVRDKYDLDLNSTIMVGDSLSSDITGAHNLSIPNCYISHNGLDHGQLDPQPDMVSINCHNFLDYISEIRSS